MIKTILVILGALALLLVVIVAAGVFAALLMMLNGGQEDIANINAVHHGTEEETHD